MYKIKLTEVSEYNLVKSLGKEAYASDENAVIEFDVEIDARSWGIKEINPSIKSILFSCLLIDDVTGEETEYSLNLLDAGFTVTTTNLKLGSCYPSDVDVDFSTKTVEVIF